MMRGLDTSDFLEPSESNGHKPTAPEGVYYHYYYYHNVLYDYDYDYDYFVCLRPQSSLILLF